MEGDRSAVVTGPCPPNAQVTNTSGLLPHEEIDFDLLEQEELGKDLFTEDAFEVGPDIAAFDVTDDLFFDFDITEEPTEPSDPPTDNTNDDSLPSNTKILQEVAMATMKLALRACKKSVESEVSKHAKLSAMGPCKPSQDTATTDEATLQNLLRDLRILFSFDGEYFQLEALDILKDLPEFSAFDFYKFCASLSFTQQPSDKASSYRVMKRLDRTAVYVETQGAPEHLYMTVVDAALAPVDSASRHTFRRFFLSLPTYLHVAFSPKHVKNGFKNTGLVPYNPNIILRHWPSYAQITTAQSQGLLDAVDNLSAKVKSEGLGYLLNSTIHASVEPFLPASCLGETTDKVYGFQLNRWGATWLNNAHTQARLKELRDRALQPPAPKAKKQKMRKNSSV